MKKADLEFVTFDTEDVITTSGVCPYGDIPLRQAEYIGGIWIFQNKEVPAVGKDGYFHWDGKQGINDSYPCQDRNSHPN